MRPDRQPPTGQQIATEIEREVQLRLFPLRHVTLAPAEFHVYLHPDDYAYLEAVVPRIVVDVQACLNALVERLNAPTLWTRLTSPSRMPPIEVPAGGWAIHIKPAANDEVGRGELGIESRLAVPAGARFGTGSRTVRIAETLVTPTERRTGPPTDVLVPDVPPETTTASTTPTGEVPPLPRSVTFRGPRLVYRDDAGEHTYAITKEITKIGRGGSEYWVDVMVVTGPQASREHCRIRSDASGRLFLQDVSTWGTSLNGERIEKYVESDPAPREYELTHGASIRLADTVTLELLLR